MFIKLIPEFFEISSATTEFSRRFVCVYWHCMCESQIKAVWAPSCDVGKRPVIFMCSLTLDVVLVCFRVFVLCHFSLSVIIVLVLTSAEVSH